MARTLYHASKHRFDFPAFDKSTGNRENHENGALGLWVAERSDWIGAFGNHVYALRLEGREVDLSISELASWATQRVDEQFYEAKRAEWAQQGSLTCVWSSRMDARLWVSWWI